MNCVNKSVDFKYVKTEWSWINWNELFHLGFKIKSTLSPKRFDSLLSKVKQKVLSEKDSTEWNQKNADADALVKLSLSDEQTLQFAAEENAKTL